MRIPYFPALLGLAVLLSVPLLAQGYGYGVYAPGIITPEVHLGSLYEPSVVTLPPVLVETPELPIAGGYAPPYGMEPEAPGIERPEGFDYLISPTSEFFPGNMADASISLGEYARELRSRPREGPPPVHLTP
jgi:hypothetical protein